MINNKHIAVLEVGTSSHSSMIYNYAVICAEAGFKLTLFLSEEVYENVRGEIDQFIFEVLPKTNDESMHSYLGRCERYCIGKNVEVIVFLTLQYYFFEFFLHSFKGMKRVVTVHNSNAWFAGNILRKPQHLLKRLFRTVWRRRADGFVVNSNSMLRNSKEKGCAKPIVVIPFSLKHRVGSDRGGVSKSGEFTITYPGFVNPMRKRYDSFIKLAKKYQAIKFILLGKLNHEVAPSESALIKKLSLPNLKIYSGFIPASEYHEVMKQTDILFSDVVVEFKVSDFNEQYGITKDSGVSYLQQEYELPTLLNADFNNLDHLKDGTIFFSDTEEIDNLLKEEEKLLQLLEDKRQYLKRVCPVYTESRLYSKSFGKFIAQL
jgi:hypothetical protein